MKPTIEKVSWAKAKLEIEKIGSEFVNAANEVDGIEKQHLWRVTYPYGASVIKDGLFCLPDKNGNLVSINDKSLSEEIRRDLSYSSNIPVGIVVDKVLENYFEQEGEYIPFKTMPPGRVFSLWASLQDMNSSCYAGGLWQVTAGARSLLMLPKISENLKFKRLKKEFCLKNSAPKTMLHQFEVYKEIANHPDFSDNQWQCVVYFFPALWIEGMRNKTPAWRPLRTYCLEHVWKDTEKERDEFIFKVAFSLGLKKNLKPNPYLFDVLKHVYNIARGENPGFRIARNDLVAPVQGIQKVFDEVYKLPFIPTMVHLANANQLELDEGLYYSLEVPIMLSFSPKARALDNKLEDLREIRHIANRLGDYIREDSLKLKETPLYSLIESLSLDYFHSVEDRFGEIKNSSSLLTLEKSIILSEIQKPFCHTSSFLRGCIRISKKTE